jgi:hypothetical protein
MGGGEVNTEENTVKLVGQIERRTDYIATINGVLHQLWCLTDMAQYHQRWEWRKVPFYSNEEALKIGTIVGGDKAL